MSEVQIPCWGWSEPGDGWAGSAGAARMLDDTFDADRCMVAEASGGAP